MTEWRVFYFLLDVKVNAMAGRWVWWVVGLGFENGTELNWKWNCPELGLKLEMDVGMEICTFEMEWNGKTETDNSWLPAAHVEGRSFAASPCCLNWQPKAACLWF